MKKKGFTLVELLAVIAILAILVIVAMPNVLGMFNQAKANTFVTEVQKYMDTAKTSFMTEAMQSGGKEVVFTNLASTATTGDALPTADLDGDGTAETLNKKLAMDGSEKTYVIWFSRNGDFKRVVIYDTNFCYDSYSANGDTNATQTGFQKGNATPSGFDKSSVKVEHVLEYASDMISGTSDSTIAGCKGSTVAKTE